MKISHHAWKHPIRQHSSKIGDYYYYYTGIASTPFEQTATKAHAVVNDIQLNSSVFSSFLNIVNDKDGSFRTGCSLFQATGPA